MTEEDEKQLKSIRGWLDRDTSGPFDNQAARTATFLLKLYDKAEQNFQDLKTCMNHRGECWTEESYSTDEFAKDLYDDHCVSCCRSFGRENCVHPKEDKS